MSPTTAPRTLSGATAPVTPGVGVPKASGTPATPLVSAVPAHAPGFRPAPADPETGWRALYRSSIGKKAVMAASGLLLTAFAAVHAWGNTKLFLGEEHFNAYARFLREVGTPIFPHSGLLWLTRLALLLAAVAHVVAAWQLTRQGTTARPVSYARRPASAAAFTAPVMRLSGLVIGVFVVYHVLHLTVGSAHPAFLPESPYRNTVLAFRAWPAVLAYAAAMLALGAHLYHGITSAMQSLGLVFGPRSERLWRLVAVVVTVEVTGVNLLVPAAVLLGVVG